MADKTSLLPNFGTRENREAHRAPITQVSWNCQGKKLASGGLDEVLRIWNVELSAVGKDKRDSEIALGREPNEIIWHPAHPDLVASCGADNLIKVWDTRSSKAAYTTKLKKQGYMFLAWNPGQPDIVAAVHQNNETAFIDSRNQKVLSFLASDHQVNEVRFSQDGKLFFRCVGHEIEIFSYPGLIKLHAYYAHSSNVYCIDLTDQERVMATGGADGIVSITDMDTLTSMKSYFVMDSAVKQLGFSCDGQLLTYWCLEEKNIFLERWQTGERALIETPALLHSMKWNPQHMVMAYTGAHFDAGKLSSRSFGNFNIYAPKSS